MRKLLQTFILLLFTAFCLNAQITINSGSSPLNYVNNLVGNGITFSNVQYSGDTNGIGFFNTTNPVLGFNNGVILSTDAVQNADFNLIPSFPGFDITEGLDQTSLPELVPFVSQCFSPLNDGLILQFDFVPQSTPVSFNYVFASQEYASFVCSQYNDAFAFLISGPGIVGQQNLAVVPGTNDPITISTINDGVADGAGGNLCILTNSAFYNATATDFGTGINFNGFTLPLTAVTDVIPCQTYTIRLMIADGCDGSLGSAVFLQANSFGSTPVSINTLTLNNDSTTYEGCAPASIVVTKNDPSLLNSDVSVDLTIQGTATNGVDYTGLPTTLTIPAGSLTANLALTAIEDGIAESTESVIISYPVGCGLFDTLVIFIRNKPQLIVTPDPAPSLCGGQGPVTISAAVTGGVAPITYSWSNSLGTALSASVNPLATTTYTLTATDYCGTVSNGTVTVPVGTTPEVPIIQQPVGPYCENETISTIASTSTSGASLVWTGPSSFLYTGTTVSIPNSTVVNSGNYSVYASLNGCDSQPANINILVKPRPTPPQLGSNSPACEGTTLSLTAITTPANSVISWTGPDGFAAVGSSQSIASVTLPAAGIYAATAELNGCVATDTSFTSVVINDTPDAPNASSNSPVCTGFDLNLTSTSIGDSYLWTGPEAWTANTQNATRTAVNNTQFGTYALSVTVNNCTSPPTPVNVLVIDASFVPTIGTNSPICEDNTLSLNTSSINNATYHWSGPNGFSSNLQNTEVINAQEVNEGTYSLYLVIGSCTTATNQFTGVINPKPIANAGLDVQVCSEQNITIGESSQPNYTYSWSPSEGLNVTNISNPTFNGINLSGIVIPKQFILTSFSSGCQDNDTVTVELNPQPIATFETPQPQCYRGNSFDFKAEGEYSDLARFVWSFGSQATPDSSASSAPSDVTFNTTGQQMVRLVIIDRGCYSNTYVVPVNVLKMPVANFTASRVETCEPSLIVFNNISENENGILNYAWSFGNGKNSSLENPSILFNNSGLFDVKLTVSDLNNCSDTYEVKKMLTVNPTPVSQFSAFPLQTSITNPG